MAWSEYLSNHVQNRERADPWRGFQNRFMGLAREEQGRTEVISRGKALQVMDQVLRATCNYEKHPEGWEQGKPEHGLICLLDAPPHGVWHYANRGISENFFERVRLCVAEAGRALPDCPKDADPEDFWLHRLYLDLLKNESDQLFSASEEGGMILSVCVASATFCARLKRQGLGKDESRNLPEQQQDTGGDLLRTSANQAEGSRVDNNGKTTLSAGGKATDRGAMERKMPLTWQEIEITFLSDHRVEICYGVANRKTYNYGELGFQDRRSGKNQEPKPARAWIMLCEFAKQNGTLPRSPAGRSRTMMQKRIEEIREKLRDHFEIDADPIPFNGDTYQTSFKIGCGASFHT